MSVRSLLDKTNIWICRRTKGWLPSAVWVGLICSTQVLNRTKGWARKNSFCIQAQLPQLVFSHLQTWTPTETYTISFPASQAFGLRLELIPPGFPSCMTTDLGLVSLCNHMSQFLTVNKSLCLSLSLSVSLSCVCTCVCFSGESSLIPRTINYSNKQWLFLVSSFLNWFPEPQF